MAVRDDAAARQGGREESRPVAPGGPAPTAQLARARRASVATICVAAVVTMVVAGMVIFFATGGAAQSSSPRSAVVAFFSAVRDGNLAKARGLACREAAQSTVDGAVRSIHPNLVSFRVISSRTRGQQAEVQVELSAVGGKQQRSTILTVLEDSGWKFCEF